LSNELARRLASNSFALSGFGSIAVTLPEGPTSEADSIVYQPMFAPISRTCMPGRTRSTKKAVTLGSYTSRFTCSLIVTSASCT
jgi:hypothetical protein